MIIYLRIMKNIYIYNNVSMFCSSCIINRYYLDKIYSLSLKVTRAFGLKIEKRYTYRFTALYTCGSY